MDDSIDEENFNYRDEDINVSATWTSSQLQLVAAPL